MLSYNATVTNGKLVIVHKERLLKELQSFEGKALVISIEKRKKNRSSPQNRFYWSVCVQLVLKGLIDAGWNASEVDTETVHDYLKAKFLKKEVVNTNTGEIIELNASTKKLSTVEFMDYIASIQQWAAEYLGLFIPSPNEMIDET